MVRFRVSVVATVGSASAWQHDTVWHTARPGSTLGLAAL